MEKLIFFIKVMIILLTVFIIGVLIFSKYAERELKSSKNYKPFSDEYYSLYDIHIARNNLIRLAGFTLIFMIVALLGLLVRIS